MAASIDDHDLEPSHGKQAFRCQHCGVYTSQEWLEIFARQVVDGEAKDYPLSQIERVASSHWKASRCFNCNRVTIWHEYGIIWPAVKEVGLAPVQGMPENVLELYEEGRRVASVSRRAGAALLRAALERLVNELDAGSGNLSDKIGRLHPRVSSGLGKALDILRTAGNSVLHEETPSGVAALVIDENAAGESPIFDYLSGVVNRLTEELITGPAQDERLFAELPPGIREAIDRRDSSR